MQADTLWGFPVPARRSSGILFEHFKHNMKKLSFLFLSIVLSATSAQAQTVHYVDLGAREMSIDSYNSHSQKILSMNGNDIERLGIKKLSDMYINETRWLILKEYEE